MKNETTVAPPNSMIAIMDRTDPKIPLRMGGRPVAWTASCIVIGTRSEMDGATKIVLTDEIEDDNLTSEMLPVFQGKLETPSCKLDVCTILNKVLLEIPTTSISTMVKVFTNREREPTFVIVSVQK